MYSVALGKKHTYTGKDAKCFSNHHTDPQPFKGQRVTSSRVPQTQIIHAYEKAYHARLPSEAPAGARLFVWV